MYWVIQNNLYAEAAFDELLSALRRKGINHSVHKAVPFTHALEPEVTPPPGTVMVIGTWPLSEIAIERGWVPGTYTNHNFNFLVQRQFWGKMLLNADARDYQLCAVPEQTAPFFIRPTDDGKAFSGQVMDWNYFSAWRDSASLFTPLGTPSVTSQTDVIIAEQKEILSEYRLFVVDRKIVTGTCYRSHGELVSVKHVPEQIIGFAEAAIKLFDVAPAYVLDIAFTIEGPKIIEVNNINAAGWYAADMDKLVGALEELGNSIETRKCCLEFSETKEREKEAVDHPAHYNNHPSGIEAITIVEHFNFNIGNAMKYLWRAGLKGDAVEDLKKAAWYANREIAKLEEKK